MLMSLMAATLPVLLKMNALGLCAACRQALESSGQVGLEKGLAWSVVLLLSAPAFMVTIFIVVVVRATRKHQAGVAEAAATATAAAQTEPAGIATTASPAVALEPPRV